MIDRFKSLVLFFLNVRNWCTTKRQTAKKIAFSEVNYTFDEQLSGSFSTLKYCEGKLINCRRKNVHYAFCKIACLFLAKF